MMKDWPAYMRGLTKTQVGIPALAVFIGMLVASWYWAFWLWLNDVKGKHSLFEIAVFVLFPFAASIFAVIMLISHFRTGRQYPWWVRAGVTAASTIWLVLLSMVFW